MKAIVVTDQAAGTAEVKIGNVATLDDAGAAFNPTERIKRRTLKFYSTGF